MITAYRKKVTVRADGRIDIKDFILKPGTKALASRANYLITGDADFEKAHKFGGVTILSVSMFRRLVMGEL